MKIDIENEVMNHLQSMFADAVEQGKYTFDEFPKFIEDVIAYGTVVMDKIISVHVEEDDLTDSDEIIILSRENMFSEN